MQKRDAKGSRDFNMPRTPGKKIFDGDVVKINELLPGKFTVKLVEHDNIRNYSPI